MSQVRSLPRPPPWTRRKQGWPKLTTSGCQPSPYPPSTPPLPPEALQLPVRAVEQRCDSCTAPPLHPRPQSVSTPCSPQVTHSCYTPLPSTPCAAPHRAAVMRPFAPALCSFAPAPLTAGKEVSHYHGNVNALTRATWPNCFPRDAGLGQGGQLTSGRNGPARGLPPL